VFLCLLAQVAVFPALIAADDSEKIVRMDGKAVYIPEIKLTGKANPVTTFLYAGSWEGGAGRDDTGKSLCAVDTANNRLFIKSPQKLLDNSRARRITQNNASSFFDEISWGLKQATHILFKVASNKRQPVVLEIHADTVVALFHNGKPASHVNAGNILASGGRAYFQIMLEPGENIINVKQFSISGPPWLQMTIFTDHSHDLRAAWQRKGRLLEKFLYMPRDGANIPKLEWIPNLDNLFVSFEVRDVSANTIVFRKESTQLGRGLGDETSNLAPGIYEAIYHTESENISEYFVVGNPNALFEELQDKLAKHSLTPETKLDIEAQFQRARILLSKDNYNTFDRRWQEKLAYTLSCLANMERRLGQGVTDIAKDQPGLHIRGFISTTDDSPQFYRVYIPSTYKPGVPLPMLVMVSARIAVEERPFIAGPTMENTQEARIWALYAEKYGFAILWPGYKNAPDGNTYEALHIDEAIQAVERDYNIDKSRIDLYATCGAGYNSGRLVSEYPNRFAAIVYDRAVFDEDVTGLESSPSVLKWDDATNPSRHVIGNKNLKIFVTHDGTPSPGHGELELTTRFLEQAKAVRSDVVQCLGRPPVDTTQMDMILSWLASCKNENPDNTRSHLLAKEGYAGPISEAFATPIIVVEGTRASGADLAILHNVVESIRNNYTVYFHGAKCAVKKDSEVTQDDIRAFQIKV